MNKKLLFGQRILLILGLIRGLFLIWWEINPGVLEFSLLGGFGVGIVLIADIGLRWWAKVTRSFWGPLIGSVILLVAPAMLTWTLVGGGLSLLIFCWWGCGQLIHYLMVLCQTYDWFAIDWTVPFGAKSGAYAYYAITQTMLC